ncbi:cysteine dioxygenase family protein [Aquamicrobium soli]|uniref:Cysteine dioxygenase n=1 Tax=Aquamicrobium soli TaxID=1811518 RepID=A0ABV7K8V9_9HYPH
MAQNKVDAFMALATETIGRDGVSRSSLDKVLAELLSLAGQRETWSASVYPDPEPDERQARYLVHADDKTGYTLYLNVMRPGKLIPPHNHTTWACIAAVEGSEHNKLYERVDGGTGAGSARLNLIREVDIAPGNGVALMPNDIHSVEIRGASLIRHLHFYGRALESLSERLTFDIEAGTASVMGIGVKTRASKA